MTGIDSEGFDMLADNRKLRYASTIYASLYSSFSSPAWEQVPTEAAETVLSTRLIIAAADEGLAEIT